MRDSPKKPYLSFWGVRVPKPPIEQKMLETLLSVWTWGALVAISTGGFGLQVPLAVLTRRTDPTRRVPGRWLRLLAVAITKSNPMWDFDVATPLPDYKPGRTVVVSNHVSNSDTFLISHLPWEMKWLGKKSLFNIPIIGWMMQLAGDVPVERGKRTSARDAMDQCRKHLESGMPVMIFPEGTRSKTGELLPFKDGAFRLAIDANADILPIAVSGTRSAMPKHSWRFGFSKARVKVGQPISTNGLTRDDVASLKQTTRETIERLAAELEAS